jgi:hypothetical protein
MAQKHTITRRRLGLAAVTVIGTAGIPTMTMSSSLGAKPDGALAQELAKALRDIGGPAYAAEAAHLENHDASQNVVLHLRNCGIDGPGSARIADALMSVAIDEAAKLRSFSLSYNSIGDDGAILLARSLPRTLGELGLVGCSIHDRGMQALLEWAEQACKLRMICVEDNHPSENIRQRFVEMGRRRTGTGVYI